MTSNANKRQNIWMPLLFSVVLVGGMFIGFKLNETLSSKRSINTVIDRNDRIEEIIDLISSRYVDPIPEDTLYQDAVEGVLQHLDPHTYYLNAKDALVANESIEGNFKGIGIEYYISNDSVIIISITPDGPSEQAGLKVGDKVISIEGQIVSGVGMNDDDVRNTYQNVPKNTIVIKVLRGVSDWKEFNVAKGTIPLNSIDAAFMLTSNIGYIKLNRFSATSHEEFKQAIKQLQKSGMNSLIFDLRQNPGGLLDEGIKILDEFIEGKQLLVYTSGKSKEQTDYYSGNDGLFESGKLVVLIDEGSASASEIVAGGVQDLDRGVIVGRTSFGKGLVQEQFELSDGAALRLTVAKYYTPSGRSIQKKGDRTRMAYNGVGDEHILSSDYSKDNKSQQHEIFKTVHLNRNINAIDGGVHPDIRVAVPPYLLSTDLWTLLEIIDAYSYSYFAKNIELYTKYVNLNQYQQQFFVTKEHLNEYKNNLPPKYIQSINNVWNNPKMLDYLKQRIKANYAKFLFRTQGYYAVLVHTDEEVKAATQIINFSYSEIIPNN